MYNMIRTKKLWMTKAMAVVFIGLFIIMTVFFIMVSGFHNAKAAKPQVLNFATVSVKSKDTLWGIAKKYYSEEYGSVNAYVKEIKRCNSLTNDHIQSGTYLIVPIYAAPDNPK
ncbi:MAG: LysM peptidoglycan-binding domain-containing protein [Lachnospiraceae bacterium]|nr:LysM peptidoglycan-binding domain-containing protein [Lachnospiraceae bacterium]